VHDAQRTLRGEGPHEREGCRAVAAEDDRQPTSLDDRLECSHRPLSVLLVPAREDPDISRVDQAKVLASEQRSAEIEIVVGDLSRVPA